MDARALHGWVRPGPMPPGGPVPEEGETLDYLCGHWRIFQYARGHRYSVDDILVAWFGTSWCPRVQRAADLGSGIGSVGLAVAWRCPGAVLHTVEAQAISARLARKSAAFNGVADRYHVHEGDLREGGLAASGPFDLVTGSPPYWPVGSRTEAEHPQAVPARLEVRGTVADYAREASRLLAPGGLFACVLPNDQEAKLRSAYAEAGLVMTRLQELRFKEGEPYGLLLAAGQRREDLPAQLDGHPELPVRPEALVVRRADGRFHPSILPVRLAMGFPPGLI